MMVRSHYTGNRSGRRGSDKWRKVFMKRLILLAAAALLLLPALAHAEIPGFARVSYIEGDVQVKSDEEGDWLPVAVNTPLSEGDSVWSPPGGRVEIQLRNGAVLRLDGNSSLDLIDVEDDYLQFHLGMGHLYVRTGDIRNRTLRIDAGDSAVKLYDFARFRVDLTDRGDEEVSVLRGTAYVEGNGPGASVRTGEMLSLYANRSAIEPLPPAGEWEQWNADRDRRVSPPRAVAGTYLPDELQIYASDFDANGRWVYDSGYGYVWQPTVGVADWSPYRDGRWVWIRGDYVWLPYESWGWAPYHYGRWVSNPSYGWCWVPPARGDVYWAPGYVGWVTTPTYVGWVPLAPGESYYGRGYYGRFSVNITMQNPTVVNRVVYRNVTVVNAVTVVNRESFASGRVSIVKTRENVFVSPRASIGIVGIKPVSREARMPVVRTIPAGKLPPPTVRKVTVRELKERYPKMREQRNDTRPARDERRIDHGAKPSVEHGRTKGEPSVQGRTKEPEAGRGPRAEGRPDARLEARPEGGEPRADNELKGEPRPKAEKQKKEKGKQKEQKEQKEERRRE